jgi:SP family xylose:H+ symportor-like MFS transporter
VFCGGSISKKIHEKKGVGASSLFILVSAIGSAMPEMFVRPIGQGDHTFFTIFFLCL